MYVIKETNTNNEVLLTPLCSFGVIYPEDLQSLKILKNIPTTFQELESSKSFFENYLNINKLYSIKILKITKNPSYSNEEFIQEILNKSISDLYSESLILPIQVIKQDLKQNLYSGTIEVCFSVTAIEIQNLKLPLKLIEDKWKKDTVKRELRYDKCCNDVNVNAEGWNLLFNGNEETLSIIKEILVSRKKLNVFKISKHSYDNTDFKFLIRRLNHLTENEYILKI